MVTVIIPSPLRQFTNGAHAVSASGDTVGQVLRAVIATYPLLAGNLLATSDTLPPFVHVFLSGRDISALGGLDARVPDGAELLVVQAISGG